MAMNKVGVGPVFTRSEMGHSFNYQYLNTDTEKRQPRGEMGYPFYHQYPKNTDMGKRQLFLRSYQFSRKKKSIRERTRGSFFRVKRVIWVRLRFARKIRRMVWSRIKLALLSCARRKRRSFFLRLHDNDNNKNIINSWSSSCFW